MQAETSNPTKNSEDIFLEIRTAHRLLAAYYQRLLPTIEDIANTIGVSFYRWESSEFRHTARRTSNPFKDWAWNLLPANCTRYIFHNAENNNIVDVGDLMIEFLVISDSGILPSDNKNEHTIEPDGLNLPVSVAQAKSTLRIHLLTSYKSKNADWYSDIHQKCPDPDTYDEPNAKKEEEIDIYTSGFEVPLSDLIDESSVDKIVSRIETYSSYLFAVAEKEHLSQNKDGVEN